MMHDSKSVARLFAAPFTVWAVLFIVLPLFFVLYHGLTDGEGAFTLANLWEAVFADVGVAVLAILNAMRLQQMRLDEVSRR